VDPNLEELLEKLDCTRVSLENESNYAVLWLSETIDFLNNNDLAMAQWSFKNTWKYLIILILSSIKKPELFLKKSSGSSLPHHLNKFSQQIRIIVPPGESKKFFQSLFFSHTVFIIADGSHSIKTVNDS
jgi:hypothetical protein